MYHDIEIPDEKNKQLNGLCLMVEKIENIQSRNLLFRISINIHIFPSSASSAESINNLLGPYKKLLNQTDLKPNSVRELVINDWDLFQYFVSFLPASTNMAGGGDCQFFTCLNQHVRWRRLISNLVYLFIYAHDRTRLI